MLQVSNEHRLAQEMKVLRYGGSEDLERFGVEGLKTLHAQTDGEAAAKTVEDPKRSQDQLPHVPFLILWLRLAL